MYVNVLETATSCFEHSLKCKNDIVPPEVYDLLEKFFEDICVVEINISTEKDPWPNDPLSDFNINQEVVDNLSKLVDGHIITTNSNNEPIKYSFADGNFYVERSLVIFKPADGIEDLNHFCNGRLKINSKQEVQEKQAKANFLLKKVQEYLVYLDKIEQDL